MKVELAKLKIKPDRQRQHVDPDYIDKLAESLRLTGQIHSIVIDEDDYIIAGECRVRAARQLGWTHIRAECFSDLPQWKKELIELEENIRRQGLTWQEKLDAKERVHKLLARNADREWFQQDTAEHLGISTGKLSQDLQLAKAVKSNPEGFKQCKTKIQAWNAYKRQQHLNARVMLSALKQESAEQKPESKPEAAPALDASQKLLLKRGDCREIIPILPDNSIDCLITDPPWDVEYDSQFNSESWTLNDTKTVLELLKPKLVPGSLCWLFCASKHLLSGAMYRILRDLDYAVKDQFSIWYKPRVAHASQPYLTIKQDYEPIICFSRGAPKPFINPLYAVIEAKPPAQKLHPAQKPPEVIEYLIEASTVEGELVCDPFAGSGASLVAALRLGRRALGIEKLETYYHLANSEVQQWVKD